MVSLDLDLRPEPGAEHFGQKAALLRGFAPGEALELFPRLHPKVGAVLRDRARLREWVACFGSPLNLVFPGIARENGRRWCAALEPIHPAVAIRFAMKCCRSDALTAGLADAGIGMDVSSAQEVQAAMRALVPAERISFTGPDKPEHDLAMCLAHGIVVNVDSLGEADRLVALERQVRGRGRALLRLLPSLQPRSRFGLGPHDLIEAARRLQAGGVAVEGLSFHLSGYDSAERVRVAAEALELMKTLAANGFPISALSIGGGLKLSYLDADVAEGRINEMETWGGARRPCNYPYFSEEGSECQAAAILRTVLAAPVNRETVRALDLRLILEPGRALTDQCGATLYRVTGIKRTEAGQHLVVLDGTSFSASESWWGSDFMPLPVHLPAGVSNAGPAECVLVGRSCLESDVIRWRVVRFARLPRAGDLIWLHNTAGYQMDMNESAFHRSPVPRKLAVLTGEDGPRAMLDPEFTIASWTSA